VLNNVIEPASCVMTRETTAYLYNFLHHKMVAHKTEEGQAKIHDWQINAINYRTEDEILKKTIATFSELLKSASTFSPKNTWQLDSKNIADDILIDIDVVSN